LLSSVSGMMPRRDRKVACRAVPPSGLGRSFVFQGACSSCCHSERM
jgi:hypothetical protein